MVYLRLGWLTVLSSRKMVEQELYLRLDAPCCTHGGTVTVIRVYMVLAAFTSLIS